MECVLYDFLLPQRGMLVPTATAPSFRGPQVLGKGFLGDDPRACPLPSGSCVVPM